MSHWRSDVQRNHDAELRDHIADRAGGGESFAIERHRRDPEVRVEGIGGRERRLVAQNHARRHHGLRAVGVRKHDPAALPRSAPEQLGGTAVGFADAQIGDRQPLLDRLVAGVLHIAEQAIDLGRDPIRRRYILEAGNRDHRQNRHDGHGDDQFEHREAGIPFHARCASFGIMGADFRGLSCLGPDGRGPWSRNCDAIHGTARIMCAGDPPPAVAAKRTVTRVPR